VVAVKYAAVHHHRCVLWLLVCRCGGCGSKVGAQILTRALRKVKHMMLRRPEVITGLGKPSRADSIVKVGDPGE
jgi:hypothetical protein